MTEGTRYQSCDFTAGGEVLQSLPRGEQQFWRMHNDVARVRDRPSNGGGDCEAYRRSGVMLDVFEEDAGSGAGDAEREQAAQGGNW